MQLTGPQPALPRTCPEKAEEEKEKLQWCVGSQGALAGEDPEAGTHPAWKLLVPKHQAPHG